MRNFRSNCKGQFVIIAALLIAILTLSLVISIHQINLNSQELEYKPVNELLLGITNDMQRALSQSLANYTYAHLKGLPTSPATDCMSTWKKAVLTSYAGVGIKMNNPLSPDFTIMWHNATSKSVATVPYNIDLDAYGFKSWTGIASKYVNLKIFPNSIDTSIPNQASFMFQLTQSSTNEANAEPIANLTPDLITVGAYRYGIQFIPSTQTTLTYKGNGTYLTTFNQQVNSNTKGVSITLQTPDESIWISAYYYQDIFLALNSQEQNGPTENLGTIIFADKTYSGQDLGKNSVCYPTQNGEQYYLQYLPATGYEFISWATDTANISFQNPTAQLTAVTITGSGNITAIYKIPQTQPPQPQQVSITVDSLNIDNSGVHHLGSISVAGNNLASLPQTVSSLVAGTYSISYTPSSSYYFVMWQSSNPTLIRPADYRNPSTTVTVEASGTITAVYSQTPPTYADYQVNLSSQEQTSTTTNKGQIQLGPNTYSLPTSVTVTNTAYSLEYLPDAGYSFVGWIATSNLVIANPTSPTTSVTVNGGGELVAVYTSSALTPFSLTLDSSNFNSASIQHLGSISFAGSNLASLPQTVSNVVAGSYSISYTSNPSYYFVMWQSSNPTLIRPADSYSPSTTVFVGTSGTITAVYSQTPPITVNYQVSLSSQETPQNSVNKGRIQVGTNIYSLPTYAAVANTVYSLEYLPEAGYSFVSWSITGSLVVANPTSPTTSVTVNGGGDIIAIYSMPTASLSLDSLCLNSTVPAHKGAISLNVTQYGPPLPITFRAQTANYNINYIPENASYLFQYWQLSGSIALTSLQSQTTSVIVYGDATLTAVYTLTYSNTINPPYNEDWRALFFDVQPDKGTLNPFPLWSQLNSHDVTHSSSGNMKQTSIMTTHAPSPTITMNESIRLLMYMRPTPPSSVKSLEVTIGFNYQGTSYVISSCTFFPSDDQFIYTSTMDVSIVDFGFGLRIIPAGSIITITNTITFIEANGFNFVYCGADTPSRLELF